jgi:uncharacterized coiled-coil protein SlyX
MVGINYLEVLLGLCVILIGIKYILELADWFKNKFGIKTKIDTKQEMLNDRFTKIEERLTTLESHDNWQYKEIGKISQGIDEIKDIITNNNDEHKKSMVAMLRYQLYTMHDEHMTRGYIDREGLKTFLELGDLYESCGGNDIYHEKLKPEIINLTIKE